MHHDFWKINIKHANIHTHTHLTGLPAKPIHFLAMPARVQLNACAMFKFRKWNCSYICFVITDFAFNKRTLMLNYLEIQAFMRWMVAKSHIWLFGGYTTSYVFWKLIHICSSVGRHGFVGSRSIHLCIYEYMSYIERLGIYIYPYTQNPGNSCKGS